MLVEGNSVPQCQDATMPTTSSRPPLKKDIVTQRHLGTKSLGRTLGSPQGDPKAYLRQLLENGPMSQSAAMSQCLCAGVSRSSVYRSARKLNIVSFAQVVEGKRETLWALPETESRNALVPRATVSPAAVPPCHSVTMPNAGVPSLPDDDEDEDAFLNLSRPANHKKIGFPTQEESDSRLRRQSLRSFLDTRALERGY